MRTGRTQQIGPILGTIVLILASLAVYLVANAFLTLATHTETDSLSGQVRGACPDVRGVVATVTAEDGTVLGSSPVQEPVVRGDHCRGYFDITGLPEQPRFQLRVAGVSRVVPAHEPAIVNLAG